LFCSEHGAARENIKDGAVTDATNYMNTNLKDDKGKLKKAWCRLAPDALTVDDDMFESWCETLGVRDPSIREHDHEVFGVLGGLETLAEQKAHLEKVYEELPLEAQGQKKIEVEHRRMCARYLAWTRKARADGIVSTMGHLRIWNGVMNNKARKTGNIKNATSGENKPLAGFGALAADYSGSGAYNPEYRMFHHNAKTNHSLMKSPPKTAAQ
jgi:hypothetical protein